MTSILPSSWNTPELFRLRLGEQAGRQRAMVAEGHLLMVVHKVPVSGETEREAVLFWRDPKGIWKSTAGGSGVGDLLELMGAYGKAVDQLEAHHEKAANATAHFEVLRESAPLLRSIRNLLHTLQVAREAIPADRNILNARDRAADLERAVELTHADARNGLDYMVARQTEEHARNSEELVRSGHRLNLLVALFLPLTAIASVFGMNLVSGLEEVRTPALFWGILGVGLVMGWLVKSSLSSKSKE